VIRTGPLLISSSVAYTFNRWSKGPGPPYDPGLPTWISPAFLDPILATIRPPTGTGSPDEVASPKNSEGICIVGCVVGAVVGTVVMGVVGGITVVAVVTGDVVGTVVMVGVGVGVGVVAMM
jgi:hypothetical protein